MGEEYRDGLFGRTTRKGGIDVVPPELEAKSADLGGGDCIGYVGDLDVERSNSEVSGLSIGWDEGAEGRRWGVVLPLSVFSSME